MTRCVFLSIQKCSQYLKMLTTKQLKPPNISCPGQFPYIGGGALAQQPPQHGQPMINSATDVLYVLSPQGPHAWPVALRDGSPVCFQVTNFNKIPSILCLLIQKFNSP